MITINSNFEEIMQGLHNSTDKTILVTYCSKDLSSVINLTGNRLVDVKAPKCFPYIYSVYNNSNNACFMWIDIRNIKRIDINGSFVTIVMRSL